MTQDREPRTLQDFAKGQKVSVDGYRFKVVAAGADRLVLEPIYHRAKPRSEGHSRAMDGLFLTPGELSKI